MVPLRQRFTRSPSIDIPARVRAGFEAAGILESLKPGARIAVGVGSRGISNLSIVVRETLSVLRSAGARPFVIPAMGSHGGATPEGQLGVLAEYGVTPESVGAEIDARMEVDPIGTTPEDINALWSRAALEADGVMVINRVKPHTDFQGTLGSGLLKMLVIGLGKHAGAAACHAAASRRGYEPVLRSVARHILQRQRILGGVALVEGPFHETARVEVLPGSKMEQLEPGLLEEARRLMPRLPFEEIDLLIVDRLGKNISGAGIDPNVIGRGVHGYSTSLAEESQSLSDRIPGSPRIHRIFVRDLTPETHGNAIGIGAADFTTTRLVRSINHNVTFTNALTALTMGGAKIPIHFDTDKECVERAVASLALAEPEKSRVVRIADTLSLAAFDASESLSRDAASRAGLEVAGPARDFGFGADDNLLPLG
jgi:hypothetical protein